MNKQKYTFFLLGLILIHSLNAQEKAVVCVPIADLLGQSAYTLYPNQPISQSYNMLPVSYKTNTQYACPRVHQLLYNDLVNVLEVKGEEAHIQISQLFYTTLSSSIPQITYWTQTKNICLLHNLINNNIDVAHIPQAIDFKKPKEQYNNHITITYPHYDPATKLTFSAGTRFVCAYKRKKNMPKKIKVYAIDYTHNKEVCIHIPSYKCYLNNSTHPREHIKEFVLLLKSWAHQKDSFIPYVWGGTSFTNTLKTSFKETTKQTNGHTYSFFEFDNDQASPKNGFDCSGIIARAAQICSIPYFYKNTTTIGKNLQQLQPEDILINGDLILIKGHVMIISDIDNNLLVEARSYGHGYGKVHEIELNKVFDSIEVYKDLCEAFFNKKELKRKDINGNIRDTFNDWKILRIMSVYD
jgi:cell wall-associated NlpC family hydrolase